MQAGREPSQPGASAGRAEDDDATALSHGQTSVLPHPHVGELITPGSGGGGMDPIYMDGGKSRDHAAFGKPAAAAAGEGQ